jgi:hypothetical protein
MILGKHAFLTLFQWQVNLCFTVDFVFLYHTKYKHAGLLKIDTQILRDYTCNNIGPGKVCGLPLGIADRTYCPLLTAFHI